MSARVLVLIQQDEEAEMVARLLATLSGFEVDLTTDPAAALNHLPGSGVGVVVLGMDLGGQRGPRVLEAIRSLRDDAATVPVVMVVDEDRAIDRVRAWEAGADAVLVKPFHIDELRSSIDAVMERSHRQRERVRHDGLSAARAAAAQTPR